MSYPPLGGYGSYYDTTPSQNTNPTYSGSRQGGSSSYGQQYQGDERPAGYGSSAYDWQGQNQPGYSSNSQYGGNENWRDSNGQSSNYDYRREASNYATQAAAGSTSQQSYYGSTSQAQQGLNNLAYASGLDNRGNSRSQQPQQSKYSTTPNPIINRVQSPVQGVQQQTYSSAQPANYGTHDNSSSSTNSPQLAINAAQALAGAVNRKFPQRTASPTVPTSSSRPAQRANSPYTAAPNPSSHNRGVSGQSQSRSPIQTHKSAPAQSRNHARKASQNKKSAASQSSSISNLVTTSSAGDMPASTVDSMPTYIDPTQVFNPYHKEHERRRREAAEAEVQRKAREEAEAKAAEEQKKKDEEAAKAAPKKTVTKKKAKSSAKAAAAAAPPPSEEDTMASEMKLMMEKMKEFRSKDPSLFQKLWDDMRKGGGTASTSAPAKSTSPATTAPPRSNQKAKVQPPATSAAPAAPTQASPPTQDSTPPAKPKIPKSQRVAAAASMYPGAAANGYKVVVEDNHEGLPDIGRFPAERRIRAQHYDKKPKHPNTMPEASAGAFPSAGLGSSIPAPNQPLPATTSGGGVEWPKEKRSALAEAAIESLKADGRNEGVEITQDEIIAMLEQNPSYIQLCGMLEKKGLRFHRGQFARQLLVSVPDLTTPAAKKDAQPRPTPATQAPIIPPPQGGFIPAPAVPHFQTAGSPPYSPYGQPGIKPEHTPIPGQKPNKSKKAPPAKPEPPPGSKEAMARKRDFSELVDLTQLSDNEDYVLSSKPPRLDSPSPEPDPFANYLSQQMMPNTVAQPVTYGYNLANGTPLKFDPTVAPKQNSWSPHPTPPPSRPKTILARPLNKNEALRKSYYDPRTVARDILIAAGRHPTERPLNAHLAGLLGVHVDMESDLSTFDWDAIDPGGPPAPKVEFTDIPAGPPRFKLGEFARSRGPSSSRLLDGDKREVHDRTPHRTADSSTPTSFKTRSEHRPSRLRQSTAVDEQSPARSSPDKRNRTRTSASPATSPMEEPKGHFWPSGKRRGRPPGAKNKHVSVKSMKSAALRPSQPVVEVPMAVPSNPKAFKCRWRNCETQALHNLETLRKHVHRKHKPNEDELQDHQYVCWWKDCEYLKREGATVTVERTFHTEEEWRQHIEDSHLAKIAMKFGDGPSDALIGKL
jgi:hypothetical protein